MATFLRAERIDPENLRVSPSNPRQIYDEASLQELATDMKHNGQLQPVRVRWLGVDPEAYELVFGHRRRAAAIIAGLPLVDCEVWDMTDEEVLRAQISENLSRQDVHAIEEAQGFAALMREHGTTAEQLIEQTGKSRSYIYGRLKLLNAIEPVRQACLQGDIGTEVCLLIARIHSHKLQEKALAAITAKYLDLEDGGAKSFRQIRELLREKFTLDLDSALFDPTDALLIEAAGPCMSCPKLSGNAPEYADLCVQHRNGYNQETDPRPDLCTDPDCFEAKKKQHLANEAAKLEQKGATVITGAKARQIVGAHGDIKGGYIALEAVKAQIKKVKGTKPQTVTIQDPRNGKLFEAVKAEDLADAGIKTEHVPAPAGHHGSSIDYAKQRAAAQAKREAEERQRFLLITSVRAAAREQERSTFDLRIITRTVVDALDYDETKLLERIWQVGKHKQIDDAFINNLGPADLAAMLLDTALVRDHTYRGSDTDVLMEACQHYGIDPEAQPAAQAEEQATTDTDAQASEDLEEADA